MCACYLSGRAITFRADWDVFSFCGLNRPQQTFAPRLENGGACWMYRYDDQPGTWTKVVQQAENERGARTGHDSQRPRPRYAHQIVYDTTTKTAYLHGGNSGRNLENGDADESVGTSEDALAEQRLDDFWSMQLRR